MIMKQLIKLIIHGQISDGDILAAAEQEGGHLPVDHDDGSVSVDRHVFAALQKHRSEPVSGGVLVLLRAVGAEISVRLKGIILTDVIDLPLLQGDNGIVPDVLKNRAEFVHGRSPFLIQARSTLRFSEATC